MTTVIFEPTNDKTNQLHSIFSKNIQLTSFYELNLIVNSY